MDPLAYMVCGLGGVRWESISFLAKWSRGAQFRALDDTMLGLGMQGITQCHLSVQESVVADGFQSH